MHKFLALIDRWYYGNIPPVDSQGFVHALTKSVLLFEYESGKKVNALYWGERAGYYGDHLYIYEWILDYKILASIYPDIASLPLSHTILGLWNGCMCWEGTRLRMFPKSRPTLYDDRTRNEAVLDACYEMMQDWHIREDQAGATTECFTGFYTAFMDNEYTFENHLEHLPQAKDKADLMNTILRLVNMYRTAERRSHELWLQPIWEDIASLFQRTEQRYIVRDSKKLYDLIMKLFEQEQEDGDGGEGEGEADEDRSMQKETLTCQPTPSEKSKIKEPKEAESLREDKDRIEDMIDAVLKSPDRWGEVKELVERPLPEHPATAITKDEQFEGLAQALLQVRTPRAIRSDAEDTGLRPHRQLIHRIVTDSKIFARTEKVTQTGDPEVIMLLDASGSMRSGNLWKRVVRAGWAAHDSFCNARIRVQTWAHTTVDIGRYEHPCVYHIATDQSYALQWQCAYNIDNDNNADGYAIEHVSHMFRYREKEPILLVWSDGQPSAIDYGGHGAIRHTMDTIDKVRSRGITVLSISLVSGVMYTNNKIYGTEHNIDASGDLSETIAQLVKAIGSK